MEYCLMGILYIFQKLMNTILDFTVDNGGSIGLIILVVILLKYILSMFSISASRVENEENE